MQHFFGSEGRLCRSCVRVALLCLGCARCPARHVGVAGSTSATEPGRGRTRVLHTRWSTDVARHSTGSDSDGRSGSGGPTHCALWDADRRADARLPCGVFFEVIYRVEASTAGTPPGHVRTPGPRRVGRRPGDRPRTRHRDNSEPRGLTPTSDIILINHDIVNKI